MLEPAKTYEQVLANFKWQIPDRFNMAHAVCTRWALDSPDKVAIIEHMQDGPVRTTSFLQLEEMSNRFANLLVKSGIGRGDRVALLLPQSRETAAAHVAIYKIGAIAVPLAMLFGVEAVQYRLQNSGAKALIISAASRENVSEVLPGLEALQVVFCIDGKLDIAMIRPIARMGYYDYTVIENVFEMRVPGATQRALDGLEGRSKS